MHRSIYFFVITLFWSCSDHKNTNAVKKTSLENVRIDTTFYKNGKIEQILRINTRTKRLDGRCESYYSSGELRTVKYFYDDTARGSSFVYYQNGKLKTFAYLCDNNYSSVIKEFDSTGKLLKEEGTPFAKYEAYGINTDTLHLKLYLSVFGHKQIDFEASPNGLNYSKFSLENGNVEGSKVVKLWKFIKGLDHTSMYMKITCTDSVLRQKIYFDTLNLF